MMWSAAGSKGGIPDTSFRDTLISRRSETAASAATRSLRGGKGPAKKATGRTLKRK